MAALSVPGANGGQVWLSADNWRREIVVNQQNRTWHP